MNISEINLHNSNISSVIIIAWETDSQKYLLVCLYRCLIQRTKDKTFMVHSLISDRKHFEWLSGAIQFKHQHVI